MSAPVALRPVRPAPPADLWRLADLAEARGVRILVEPISGEHFATAATDPTIQYKSTTLSCTCKGFVHRQRCTHHSLLLAQLGWLPDLEPEPEPPAQAASRRSNGFELSDEELVIAGSQAARAHAERDWPLVDEETDEVLAT
jgi:hypothetical protein